MVNRTDIVSAVAGGKGKAVGRDLPKDARHRISHGASRERRRLLAPRDRHLAALQRLTQGLDDVGVEERELVEGQGM